ncbi:MAG: tetratricopeptide repeat protein [Candidatus Aminicenantales bacterium]
MKAKTILTAMLCLALLGPGASLFAQNELATKLLAENNTGVITLVILDKDKKEIGYGAAVVLSPTKAVTTYHLISGAADVKGFNFKKRKVDVEGILAVDKVLDLALLQIDGKVEAFPAGAALAANMTVVALGSDKAGDMSAAEGKIRKLFDLAPGVKVADSSLGLTDEFDGGAILDETGKLVGLVNAYDMRLRFIVPTPALMAMASGTLVTFKSRTPEDFKESIEAAWMAGRMYMWLDVGRPAVQSLEKVTKAQPDNAEAWKYLAEVYETQRDFEKSAAAYEQLTRISPDNAAAFAGLGRIQSRLRKNYDDTSNLGKAAQNLEKALQLDPSLIAPYQYLGNCYEGLKEWAKAGDAYEKYLASKPADAMQVFKVLGNVRREAGQFENAAKAYAEVLKISPDDTYINYQYAQMLENSKKYDEAEAAYMKTGEVAQEPAKYVPNIISMYDKANMTDKAIAACKKLIEMAPNNEQSHYNLGMEYMKLQKNAEAIEAFTKAVEIKPTFDFAWFQIGSCYYGMKKYTNAITAFQKNTALVPDQIYGWMYLGMSQMQVKQFAAALDSMKKAVEINPSNTDALFNLGVIYLNLKDKFSAKEIVKQLQALDPDKAKKLNSYIK